jgi:Ca-activated chloride channel family protein
MAAMPSMPSMPHDESPALRDPARRRRLLLGGASLLALGVVVNAGRFVAVAPEELGVDEPPPRGESKAEASHSHRGEEGKMGRPTAKSGLYAMRGPSAPLAAQAVAAADEDVWGALTGAEVGESFGVGGLGLVGTGRGGGGTGEGTIGLGNTGLIGKGGGKGSGSGYGRKSRKLARDVEPSGGTFALPPQPTHETGFLAVAKDPLSTFSIDVDTASYSSVRRSLNEGRLPQADAVRIEELVNYFDYDYVPPSDDAPFSVTAEVGDCPWNPEHELVHVGLQGKTIAPEVLPPRNLVFLVDVSGSMQGRDKLPLVKHSLLQLAQTLRAEDRISLVVYAGAAGVVLPPTPGNDAEAIRAALLRLEAGGSTNGAEGIEAAYAQARAAFMKEGVNRVILASDGDFNVGVSSHDALVKMIEKQRRSGVELSVLGYGMGARDHTMEQLADKGNGNYAYIDGPEEAHKVLVEEAGGTLVTIAKDVKIQVELDPARVLSYRLVGYENRRLAHEDFADDSKDAGEIGAGHSVTALYEVVPRPEVAAADAPWMTVQLRYKQPKGDDSTLLRLPVVAEPRELSSTSDDFRFSAAVASYGMLLAGSEHRGKATWVSTQQLAQAALGEDPSCRRHRFLELVGQAGMLAGDRDVRLAPVICEPGGERVEDLAWTGPAPEPYYAEPIDTYDMAEEPEPEPDLEPFGLGVLGPWALEVLRLLPPLLALPLFIMAYRRPRRRDPS